MAILSERGMKDLGLTFGSNVKISTNASIYGGSRIKIGNNVRIDDFVVLSAGTGGIEIGNYIHIAVFTSLIGNGKITIRDFANFSSKVSVYSSNDDYSGETLTSPMVPDKYKNVKTGNVWIGRGTILGCGSVILPDVHIGDYCSIGALSLVNRNLTSFGIYGGIPVRYIGYRKNDMVKLEEEFLKHEKIEEQFLKDQEE